MKMVHKEPHVVSWPCMHPAATVIIRMRLTSCNGLVILQIVRQHSVDSLQECVTELS